MDTPRRDRVWQLDFSEFETSRGGTWQLAGIVDYATKLALGCIGRLSGVPELG